jgi:tetratricopeptide (TPR) repeat protein
LPEKWRQAAAKRLKSKSFLVRVERASHLFKKRHAFFLSWLLCAGAPTDRLAPLFSALKSATTEQQSQQAETQIILYWRSQITPAVQLLLDHASRAMEKHDLVSGIEDLDAALDLQPDQADLWRLHAEARFANGDEKGAIADIAQALAREPRCFTALADLSRFAEERRNNRQALEAWMRFLQIDPKAPQAAARLQALQRKLSGEPL